MLRQKPDNTHLTKECINDIIVKQNNIKAPDSHANQTNEIDIAGNNTYPRLPSGSINLSHEGDGTCVTGLSQIIATEG